MFSNNINIRKDTPKRGRPRGRTEQGHRTRLRLYRTALRMIARRGYEGTTLRDIAHSAKVSPGLLYRYFPSKAAVVLALYDDLSHQYAGQAEMLPAGRWRTRFLHALRASLSVLRPERNTLSALLPILVNTGSESLFAPATEFSRLRVQAVFAQAVAGASDKPKNEDAAALGRLLYFAHLGVILWWLLDISPQQRATGGLVTVIEAALPVAAIALKSRIVRSFLRQVDALLRDAFLEPSHLKMA